MRIQRLIRAKRTVTQGVINRAYLRKYMDRTQDIITEVEAFRSHLRRLGYGKSSIQMLPNCLREFMYHGHLRIEQINQEDIINYHDYLGCRPNKRRAGGLSESYIHHHIYSLRLYYSWRLEMGLIKENPMSGLQFKRPQSAPREILTLLEIQQLYKASENYKEKATLSVFYGCGLRRSEGERLDVRDVHFRSGIIYVREGKGNKRRAVPMSERVCEDLKNYIYEERNGRKDEAAFITNSRGRRMRGDSHNLLLKELLKRSGIEKEVSLHSLRHSIATHLLESGLSVDYVRDFLGHQHLESTQIYTRISERQLESLGSPESKGR